MAQCNDNRINPFFLELHTFSRFEITMDIQTRGGVLDCYSQFRWLCSTDAVLLKKDDNRPTQKNVSTGKRKHGAALFTHSVCRVGFSVVPGVPVSSR